MQYLIILAIFLVPIASIVTIKGTIVWYPQLLTLQMMGGLCYASMFWKLNKFLAIFLGYLAFSYIYVASASPRTQMCLMIGYFAIAITLAVSKLKDLKWVYVALIGMSLLSIVYSILQSCGIDPIFVPIHGTAKEDVVSFMGSPNQLGIYSMANAFWSPFTIPLAIVPIFLAKCNSALIGLIAGSMVFIWHLYGKKAVSISILLVLVALVPWWHYNHKQNQEILERFKLWKLSINQVSHGKIESIDLEGHKSLIQGSPLIGFGLGNFFVYSPFSQYKMYGLPKTLMQTDKLPSGMEHFYEHAHNDLVEAFYEFGYIGLFMLILVIGSVGFVFMASHKSVGVITTFSSLIAQSVASCSVYVFHAPVSLFMFCLTLGLFYAEVKKCEVVRDPVDYPVNY